jgi:hypothetical protein
MSCKESAVNQLVRQRNPELPDLRALCGLPPIPTDPAIWKAQYCAHYLRCFMDGSDWEAADAAHMIEREYAKLPASVMTLDPVHVANDSMKVWWDYDE